MVSLGHVAEEVVTGQVDIVNDLAQVGIAISVSQVDQVVYKKKEIYFNSQLFLFGCRSFRYFELGQKKLELSYFLL